MDKKKFFRNYILIENSEAGRNLEIIKEDEVEVGFRISGVATTFDVQNENGGIFQSGDFDAFIRDYFVKNAINMLCPVEHNTYNFDNRGVFEIVEDDGKQLKVTAAFYENCCSNYKQIKGQVQRGILQGFSTFGWIDKSGNANLLDISLVGNPADVGSKIENFKNTKFIGFDFENKNRGNSEDEPKNEIINLML